MKSRNQTGSAHVIIIVVIIIILGVLGFVFWNNFLNKPASTKKSSTATTSTTTSTNPADLATLSIPELGIGLLYDKTLPTVSYTYSTATNSSAASADITSKRLIGTTCTGDTGSIAQVTKNPTTADNFNSSSTVAVVSDNSNKYYLTFSSSNCTSDTTLLTKYQSSFEHNFLNLKSE